MTVSMFSQILPPIPFDGGYVQATKSLKGTWRVAAWVERRLPSGKTFHTQAATRVRRSEDAARKVAEEMAKFWSRSNPDFAERRAPAELAHDEVCGDCGQPAASGHSTNCSYWTQP